MSWTIEDSGTARFEAAGGWRLICETADPQAGIVLGDALSDFSKDASDFSKDAGESSRDLGQRSAIFCLLPSEGHTFPPLDEYYVRKHDLVCRYPQTAEHLFGLEVCHRILLLDEGTTAIETVCSVQTNLLDSHPTFDVASFWDLAPTQLELSSVEEKMSGDRNAVTLDLPSHANTPPAITQILISNSAKSPTVFLMLPPSDRSVSTVINRTATRDAAIEEANQQYSLRYRLLAEFMEKGVIRKARIWTVICKQPPNETQVLEYYQKLLAEPLPLTP